MVSLSTVMLIILQHNVAHLGIVMGLCLSETTTRHVAKPAARAFLGSAMAAAISTALAEKIGGGIELNMLFGIPVKIASLLVAAFVAFLYFKNGYRSIEKWIIAFVSLIGLSFLYELSLAHVDWPVAVRSWVTPSFQQGSMLIIMSVLGAVVMPHKPFFHSEIIKTRQWNLVDDAIIKRQLRFEFLDTILSMLAGWAINSAMIILAAATFHAAGRPVSELAQAKELLAPLLRPHASSIFAVALLLSGVSSSITSGMAAGSIWAGIFSEPYDIKDSHSKTGFAIALVAALCVIFVIGDPFLGLIVSQMALSVQLPFTIFMQVRLTSSNLVMGNYKNSPLLNATLVALGLVVTALNAALYASLVAHR